MTPATEAAFLAFLLRCGEGCKNYLYGDQSKPKMVITSAIGCAFFSVADAQKVPWQRPDGSTATAAEVQEAWTAVSARPDLAPHGGSAFEGLTTIRLSQASIDALVSGRIRAYEAQLRTVFPGYDTAPPAAEEGLVRLAWATGAADFADRWPKFTAAFRAGEWATCASECRINGLAGEPNANTYEAELFESLEAPGSAPASGPGSTPLLTDPASDPAPDPAVGEASTD